MEECEEGYEEYQKSSYSSYPSSHSSFLWNFIIFFLFIYIKKIKFTLKKYFFTIPYNRIYTKCVFWRDVYYNFHIDHIVKKIEFTLRFYKIEFILNVSFN